MESYYYFVLALFLYCAASQQVDFTVQPSNEEVVEGGNATFECSATNGSHPYTVVWRLTRPGNLTEETIATISRDSTVPGTGGAIVGPNNGSPLVLTSVSRALNGTLVACSAAVSLTVQRVQPDPPARLTLIYPPKYTANSSQLLVVREGHSMYTYQFSLDSDPIPVDFNWTKNGEMIHSGSRVTFTVRSITIQNVVRSDIGTYTVTSRNEAGMDMANFTLDVQFPPSISVNESTRKLNPGELFTLNCTPIASNPSANVTFFYNNVAIGSNNPSVHDFTLTLSSIRRQERGNYSCNVSNIIGSVITEVVVNVIAPPTVPRGLSFSNIGPFSSTVSWSAPEDNGGDLNPPTYRINVTWSNGTRMMYTSTDLMLQLTNLWHSRNYTVSVVAVNKYGTSPPAERVLTTPDSVPIIASVSLKALNLSDVQVNITLLTDGGQSVEYYEVNITEETMQHISSETIVSFVAKGYSLSNNAFYKSTVVAKNSVGQSQPFSYMFFVPSAPIITSPPTPLEPSVISACCAGVKLNLANPNDPTLVVKVYRSGVLHPSTSRDRDNLIISGLQAGREYTFRVFVRNVFGTVGENLTLTSLLGRPSNPSVPIVAVEGTVVTVVLSTDYPGTEGTRRGSKFTFQIQFDKIGRSTRQSVSDTVDVSPLSLRGASATYRGVLEPGSYTVSVIAVNEHGNSRSVMSEQFSVQAAATRDNTTIIIGAVVGVVVFILLVLILIFICIICYKKFWRTRGHYKTESGKPVPLTNNGANGDNKEDIEMMENQTALYDEVDRAGDAAKKKKEAEAMGVVNQYDDPDVQQQPEMYAEVDHSAKTSNKKKKKKEEKQQETAPQPEVYAEVDKSAKTSKKDDEPKPPRHTEGLVYAQIDFANKSSTYKKPEPKNDDVVIYSEVTVQHQPRKQDDDKEQDGNNDRDDRGGSPNAII